MPNRLNPVNVMPIASSPEPQIDILVHSLANGPEVTKPLLETSRKALAGEGSRVETDWAKACRKP